MIKSILSLVLFCLCVQSINGQVAINMDESPAHPSAIVDISSQSKGILLPRMTTDQRNMIRNAAEGLMVYDITTNSFWFSNGLRWEELLSEQNSKHVVIHDVDGDTKISVEPSIDEDVISFDVRGLQTMKLSKNATGNPRLSFHNNSFSTIIGPDAAKDNTGSENLFYGRFSGNRNSSGSSNTFIGRFTGSNQTSASHNTYIGEDSGATMESGSENVFLGKLTGSNKVSGDRNVFIGLNTGHDSGGGSGNVFIGTEAGRKDSSSNKLIIGSNRKEFLTGSFEAKTLHWNGDLKLGGNLSTNTEFITSNGSNNAIFVSSNGNVGIGVSYAAAKLEIGGGFYANGNFIYKNKYRPIVHDRAAIFASAKVNADGSMDNSLTSSSFLSSERIGPGDYKIYFDSGTFSKPPIIVGSATDDKKIVIHYVTANEANIEVRNPGGNRISASYLIHVVGEHL